MESRDIYIVIDGSEYRAVMQEGEQSLRSEVRELKGIVQQRFDELSFEQRLTRDRVDNLQTSVYWILGAIGIFLAALAIPSILRRPETPKPELKPEPPAVIDIAEIARQVSAILESKSIQGRES